jgi:DNA polymerase-3 subunit beta
MKLTLLQEKLKNGISTVERITGRSLSLPILNNILIKAEKNFLNLAATDLEIGINWWALAKIEKEGKVAVPTKLLSSFVNFLPNKPITLEEKNLTLKIKCQNHQTSLKGFSPEEFPIIPSVADGESILVNSQTFCQNLNQVVDIASYSTARPEISGVYFLFQKDLISMAATDSFRLGEKKLFLKPPLSDLSQEYSLILPQRAAKEVINIFGEKEGDLKIYFSPNQILFEIPLSETPHPQVQLISRLIEGEFPNYQEIIPKRYDTQVVLSRNDLVNQIKLASLFSGKISEVKLKIDPKQNKVAFSSQSPDLGDYQSFLEGKAEGKTCETSFNYRFLLDGLLNIKSSEVILQLSGAEGPGVLKPKGDSSYLYLVMPIKAS